MDNTLYWCNRSRYYVDFLDVVLFYSFNKELFHQSLNGVVHFMWKNDYRSASLLFLEQNYEFFDGSYDFVE